MIISLLETGVLAEPKKNADGLKCAPGADNDQVDKIVDNACDCCGCKKNEMCRQAAYTLVSKYWTKLETSITRFYL